LKDFRYIFKTMSKWLSKWIKTVFILAWAFAFAQGPEFIHQYISHLIGHYEEIKFQDSLLKEMMGEEDLKSLSSKLKQTEVIYAVKQGEFIEKMIERKETFEAALNSFELAGPIKLPFTFINYFDYYLGKETMRSFYWGLPATWDGLIYATFGAIIGYLVWLGFGRLWCQFKKLFRRAPKPIKTIELES
jgi:hypothetical protein